MVKANTRLRQLPFVFISAFGNHEAKIKAYLSGADDFLVKPLHFPEMLAKITSILRREDNIHRDIYRDPMSKLYNRRFLELELPRQLSLHERHTEKLVVGMLDIDHFKKVNDTYGHQVGDIIIENLGAAIVEHVRISDYVIRYGGEEIVVLFVKSDINGSKNTLDRLLKTLNEKPLYEDPKQDIKVKITFSGGLAEYPTHGLEGDTIIRFADKALYEAKENGRNHIRIAAPPPIQLDLSKKLTV